MDSLKKNLIKAITFNLLLIFIVVGIASAITIGVDGTREAAWDGGARLAAADPNEIDPADGEDLRMIEWTNDTSFFYMLFETYTTTDWGSSFTPSFVQICVDIDGPSAGTGGNLKSGQCIGGGFDRYIKVQGPTPPTVVEYVNNSGTPLSTAGIAVGSGTIYTELGLPLAIFGLSGSNCVGNMPTSVYFDGASGADDDNVLDAGPFSMTCNGPTAITLTDLRAGGTQSPLVMLIVLAIAAGGFALYKVTRKPQEA